MSFNAIKGQNKAIEKLIEDVRNKHIAGAYLFCGPEGTGKYLAAKTFAQLLNCLNTDLDSCDNCLPCLKIKNNQHPDVHIIDNGYTTEIKIEEIRQLQQDINLKPYESRLKVFIINDAHNLNPISANAFLKTLEEPPKDSLIILVSDKPGLLLKTIISRCRIVKFYPLGRAAIAKVLKDDYSIDEDVLHYLAYFSEGRLGVALRLKNEDLISKKNRIIDSFSMGANSGLQNSIIQDKNDLHSSLQILAGWFRDIYLIKVGIPYTELINFDRRDTLVKLMNRYTFGELDEILNCICDSLFFLERNVNVKLLLSNLMLSLKRDNCI
jgi:DNA polymerase-3 subunit delta'